MHGTATRTLASPAAVGACGCFPRRQLRSQRKVRGASRGEPESCSPCATPLGRDALTTSAGALPTGYGRLLPTKFWFSNTAQSYPWFMERHLIARRDPSMEPVLQTLLRGETRWSGSISVGPGYNLKQSVSYMRCSHYQEMIKTTSLLSGNSHQTISKASQ